MNSNAWHERLRHLRATKNPASFELTNCVADLRAAERQVSALSALLIKALEILPKPFIPNSAAAKIYRDLQAGIHVLSEPQPGTSESSLLREMQQLNDLMGRKK